MAAGKIPIQHEGKPAKAQLPSGRKRFHRAHDVIRALELLDKLRKKSNLQPHSNQVGSQQTIAQDFPTQPLEMSFPLALPHRKHWSLTCVHAMT